MKAARIHEYGPPDVFRVEEAPMPEVGPHDVLIEVHAAAVNPVDYKIRCGGQRGAIRYKLPWILGMDVSGVVVEVGAQVRQFKVGDEVYSSPTHTRQGTYAEYVAIDADAVALKPKNISHFEAAGIPLAGLTAWESLVFQGKMKAGHKIFVQAGAGGVGSLAIQIAKHLGGHVIASCSTRNVEFVKELGADQVIDYTQQEYDQVLGDLDHVIDALGGEHQHRALTILKRGGHLAALNAGLPDNTKRFGPHLGLLVTAGQLVSFQLKSRLRYGIRTSQILRQSSGTLLGHLTELLEREAIRPIVDRVYPLEKIVKAHAYIEKGRARGKIIIGVRGEIPEELQPPPYQ